MHRAEGAQSARLEDPAVCAPVFSTAAALDASDAGDDRTPHGRGPDPRTRSPWHLWSRRQRQQLKNVGNGVDGLLGIRFSETSKSVVSKHSMASARPVDSHF